MFFCAVCFKDVPIDDREVCADTGSICIHCTDILCGQKYAAMSPILRAVYENVFNQIFGEFADLP